MNQITIPKIIEKKACLTARKLGISQEDFFINATLYYINSLREEIGLRKELEMWDRASEEDCIKFEKSL
jgi:hypothetical protein